MGIFPNGYFYRENDDELADLGERYFQTNLYHHYDTSIHSIPLDKSHH